MPCEPPQTRNRSLKESIRCRYLDKKSVVNGVTTLRRHMEAHHSGKYRKWAHENKFGSRLQAAAEVITRTLDRHLKENLKLGEQVIKYADKALLQAAIEWLVATDQPINALEHPKFKEMIDVAARATNGVKIPGRKATRLCAASFNIWPYFL